MISLAHRLKAYARHALHSEPNSAANAFFAQLPHVVFAIDQRYTWCWLNDNWRQLTGLPAKACVGQSSDRHLHPKDREYFQRLVRSAFSGHPQQEDSEVRLLTSNGDFRWLEVRISPPTSSDTETLIGTLTDITSRVAEEAALLASHRSLSTLISDLPGMVYRCRNNHAWTMDYVSRGCETLTGYSPDDIINKRLSYGSLIHPDDRDSVWIEVQSGIRERRNFETVYRLCTAAGKQKWVWERGKGVFDNNGELLSLEGFITDVTQVKLKNDALIRSNFHDVDLGTPTEQLFRDRLATSLARAADRPDCRTALLLLQVHGLGALSTQADEHLTAATKHSLAERLQPRLKRSDSLCCLAPDRFALLLDGDLDAATAGALGQRLLDSLLRPLSIDGNSCYVTASIGISLQQGGDASVDQVLREALIAMDQARELGGSRCELFEAGAMGDHDEAATLA